MLRRLLKELNSMGLVTGSMGTRFAGQALRLPMVRKKAVAAGLIRHKTGDMRGIIGRADQGKDQHHTEFNKLAVVAV